VSLDQPPHFLAELAVEMVFQLEHHALRKLFQNVHDPLALPRHLSPLYLALVLQSNISYTPGPASLHQPLVADHFLPEVFLDQPDQRIKPRAFV
jgi:hypothetical protein